MLVIQKIKGHISTPNKIKGILKTGFIKQFPELEDIIVVPSEQQQHIQSENKYGINEVTVEPMDITISSDYQDCLNISNQIMGGVV